MKRLSVFLLAVLSALLIDLTPLELKELQRDTIHVSIYGEVENEGETELDLYATLKDALEEAVLKDDADISTLNPDLILKDHDVIYVPEKKGEEEKKRISINTADADELCELSGIGPATAERIIAWRNENGLFQNIEDLMRVKGIGESRFEKIRDDICL